MIDALLKKFCRWNRYCAWSDASVWLSLDRFDRFLPDVGLTFVNGAAVKTAVRNALRTKYAMDAEHRARRAINPDAPVDMVYRNRMQTLPKGCITNIAETAGLQDAECFAKWILKPVHKAINWPHPNHFCAYYYHLAKEEPDAFALRYKIARDTAHEMIKIVGQFRSETDAIKERTQAADREPLAGWDAIAYAEYRRSTPEASPLIGVRLYLMVTAYHRVSAELHACTVPADIEALQRWIRDFRISHDYSIPDEEDIFPTEVHGPW